MPELSELARNQIRRLLRTYRDGLTPSELYLRLDNSIAIEDFDAAVAALRTTRELNEAEGLFFLNQKSAVG